MIEWINNNWLALTLIAVMVVDIALEVRNFIKKPTKEKVAKFKEWLLYAVSQAEKELGGGGTGELKLRWVYDKALEQFPWLTSVISFEKFSEYVDEALAKFKEMLANNQKIQEYVGVTKA